MVAVGVFVSDAPCLDEIGGAGLGAVLDGLGLGRRSRGVYTYLRSQ